MIIRGGNFNFQNLFLPQQLLSREYILSVSKVNLKNSKITPKPWKEGIVGLEVEKYSF